MNQAFPAACLPGCNIMCFCMEEAKVKKHVHFYSQGLPIPIQGNYVSSIYVGTP